VPCPAAWSGSAFPQRLPRACQGVVRQRPGYRHRSGTRPARCETRSSPGNRAGPPGLAAANPPASRATSPANRTYRSDPSTARPESAAASMAAVAESAATTRWRDEPRTANTAIGRSMVYKPVTSGIPAILAYPRTSGMPRAANVRPASASAGVRDRSTGTTPRITGRSCSHPRHRCPGDPDTISPPPGLRDVRNSFTIPPPEVHFGVSRSQFCGLLVRVGESIRRGPARSPPTRSWRRSSPGEQARLVQQRRVLDDQRV
jgi:hypothetical protein